MHAFGDAIELGAVSELVKYYRGLLLGVGLALNATGKH
jgi:hypothetical protein